MSDARVHAQDLPRRTHNVSAYCVREVFLPRLGRRRADPQALCQRAVAAAKAAEARYDMPDGTLIECMCIGQPHDDGELAPLFEECTQSEDLWKLPQQGDQIRLAFLWHIVQGRRVEGADSCVVRLDNAERRGVPLPPDLAPMVADLIDAGAQDKGALQAGQLCVASQPSSSTSLSVRSVAAYQRICCGRSSAAGRAQGGGDRERCSE